MMEAASTSETSVNFARLHDATTQKTAIFIPADVRYFVCRAMIGPVVY
jgi:hypothetical protein